MATLHLRNVPPEVDRALTDVAQSTGSSKNREAIAAIRRGLGLDQFDRAATIRSIRRERATVGNVDVAQLIRDERPSE
jgi:hypothetical protein